MVEYAKAYDGYWHAISIEDKMLSGRSTKKEEF